MKHYLDGPRTPVIVDRRFDIFFIVLWFIYGAWAITSGIESIPSLNRVADNLYQIIWASMVGTTALVSSMFGFFGFIPSHMKRVRKEKVEMYSTIMLAGFIGVYPCVLIYNALVLHDASVWPSFVLSFSYLLAPVYRVIHLSGRIKNNV